MSRLAHLSKATIRRKTRLKKLPRKGGRVFSDISKVMAQQDLVDYSDEEVPAKFQAQDGSEQWHSSRRSSTPYQVFDALQQLHGGKIGKSTSQVVPPELAAAALEAFYEAEDTSSEDISGHKLRSELVSSEVFAELRNDARQLLAARRESMLSESQLEVEAKEFLKRSWCSISVKGLSESSETLVELRVAQLFGALLGRVPDAALRQQFEKHFKGWSRKKVPQPSSRGASAGRRQKRDLAEELEALVGVLEDGKRSEDEKHTCAKKAMKLLTHTFSKNASKAQRRRAQNLLPASLTQVLSAVVKFNADLLEDNWEALPGLFRQTVQFAQLWASIRGAPATVRLAFLETVVVQEVQVHGPSGALNGWQNLGIEPSDVVKACTDFVFREEEEEELYRHIRVPRRPRTRKRFLRMRKRVFEQEWWGPRGSVRLTGSATTLPYRLPATAKTLLAAPTAEAREQASKMAEPEALNALGEQKEKESMDKRLRQQRKEQTSSKRAGALLQWLEESNVDLTNLNPEEALQLVLSLRQNLGKSSQGILKSWLQDAMENPLKYGEHVILSVSKALRSQPSSAGCWNDLARVLLVRWSKKSGTALAPLLEVLPKHLTAAPNALRQALLRSCESYPFAFGQLSWQELCRVMEAWEQGRFPVPLALRFLWVVAADPFIVCFTAKQLVMASRLAAAEDLQDLELPEEVPVDSAASLALEWWDRWLRSILSNPAGWFFCREALRQALAWQRWARRKKLREEVAKAEAVKVLNAVVERLGIGLDQVEVPTQLLLELLELEESGLEEKLAEELTRRIQASLCEGPVVPMSTAVALANGDTPILCKRGSLLWSGLVASIAAQLKSKRQVDDFGACRPCPDLWDDVAQLKAGSWQSLELKLRRPFS